MIGYDKDFQLREGRRGRKIFGDELKAELRRLYAEAILSGQIVCFKSNKLTYMFQVLTPIYLSTVKDNTLIGYEPGSVILRHTTEPVRVLPAFLFKGLYIPDDVDLAVYNNRITI